MYWVLSVICFECREESIVFVQPHFNTALYYMIVGHSALVYRYVFMDNA